MRKWRNAIYLAKNGFGSPAASTFPSVVLPGLANGPRYRAPILTRSAVRSLTIPAPGSVDLIYDSGCFHHLAPHQRDVVTLNLWRRRWKPGGHFGLVCFAPEGRQRFHG